MSKIVREAKKNLSAVGRAGLVGVLAAGAWVSGGTTVFASERSAVLEEVVVTDSRFKLKRENSGKTVIKISQHEIENNQGRTISELINTKSGIEINGSRSNAGQNLGVYVRGGRNRQVLVLIDGIQVNDPSELSGGYDLRLLNLNQIESIEIIKGAASTLYGSGAATAVVSIVTKAANTKKISAVFLSSIGTNQTESDQNYNIADFSNSVSLSGTLNKFTYRTAFNNQFSDGLSAAISDANEKDAYSKYGLDANLGYKFNTAFSINIYGNYTDTKSNIDGYDVNTNFIDNIAFIKCKKKNIIITEKNAGFINGGLEAVSDIIDLLKLYSENCEYDYVIHMHPDVFIINETLIVNFLNDQKSISEIIFYVNLSLNNIILYSFDFFIFKPKLLKENIFNKWINNTKSPEEYFHDILINNNII
mgnify:CR=1 FL=1